MSNRAPSAELTRLSPVEQSWSTTARRTLGPARKNRLTSASMLRTRLDYASNRAVAISRAKRAVDIAAAGLVLLFFLPLLLIIAVAIRLESPGPALFVQRRTGLDQRVFRIYKFRTMKVAEDHGSIQHATKNDSRITRFGAFLRKTSIDELPQFLNILIGDMSIVGPRPHAVCHDESYGALIPAYAARFRAKPGLTGLAQVSGFRGEIHELSCMINRVDADNAYIETWSFAQDVKIVLRTLPLLVKDPNAY